MNEYKKIQSGFNSTNELTNINDLIQSNKLSIDRGLMHKIKSAENTLKFTKQVYNNQDNIEKNESALMKQVFSQNVKTELIKKKDGDRRETTK